MPAWFWLHSEPIHCLSVFRSLPVHPSEIFALVRRVSHYVIRFTWLMGLFCLLLFGAFVFLLCLVWRSLTGFCPSVGVVFESIVSLWDSLACLALGPHRPSVSPVLCGLRLTRLTGLTCWKGICRVCGVWFLFGFWFLVLFGLVFNLMSVF